MENFREALALGLELSGFIFGSYIVHGLVAEAFGWDPNLTLVGLLGISLLIWTFHAYYFFENKNPRA